MMYISHSHAIHKCLQNIHFLEAGEMVALPGPIPSTYSVSYNHSNFNFRESDSLLVSMATIYTWSTDIHAGKNTHTQRKKTDVQME